MQYGAKIRPLLLPEIFIAPNSQKFRSPSARFPSVFVIKPIRNVFAPTPWGRVAGDYIVPYRSPKGDYRDFQDFEGSIGLGDYRDFGGVYRVENETKQS